MGFIAEYIVRNQTVTVDFTDLDVTEGAKKYLAVQTWTSAVASAFGLSALGYLLLVSCRTGERNASHTTILRLVVAQVALMTIGCVLIFIFTVLPISPSNWAVCSYLGTVPSFGYCAGNGVSYYIFLKRAGSARTQTRSRLLRILWYVALVGTYSIPGLLLLLVFTVNGRIVFGQYCFQDHPWWLAVMFTVMDTLLSSVFLFLFLEPVVYQLREMRKAKVLSASGERMSEIAQRNLLWSSVTIFTTMVFLTTVSVVPMNNLGTPETIHYLFVTWATQPLDSAANMLAIMAISTAAWLPKRHLRGEGRSPSLINHRGTHPHGSTKRSSFGSAIVASGSTTLAKSALATGSPTSPQ